MHGIMSMIYALHVVFFTQISAIFTTLDFPFADISKSQKSGHATISALTRPHSPGRLCLRLCLGLKLRAASVVLRNAYHVTRTRTRAPALYIQ